MADTSGRAPEPVAPIIAPSLPAPLAPGTFHLSPTHDDDIRAACAASGRIGDEAHPIFGFIAAIGGIGMPIGDVFAQVGGSIAAGPLLATARLHYALPLKVGITYQVGGEMLALVRKPSRRFGHADHLTLRIDVADDAAVRSSLTLTIIMPKGESA